MKKILGIVIGVVVSCGILAAVLPNRVFAACDLGSGSEEIETNIFGTVCDDGNGSAMKAILSLILQILTYGVGVGGVLGIVISGIQYLTARDNEAQAAKARRRILEVVIGLIVYAVMYVVLQFLLIPGGIN